MFNSTTEFCYYVKARCRLLRHGQFFMVKWLSSCTARYGWWVTIRKRVTVWQARKWATITVSYRSCSWMSCCLVVGSCRCHIKDFANTSLLLVLCQSQLSLQWKVVHDWQALKVMFGGYWLWTRFLNIIGLKTSLTNTGRISFKRFFDFTPTKLRPGFWGSTISSFRDYKKNLSYHISWTTSTQIK